ncbi:hypothetical protein PBNK5_18790 [Pectobacterium brasiliense]
MEMGTFKQSDINCVPDHYTRSGFSDEAAHIKYLSESKVIRLILRDQCVRIVPSTACKPLLEGCLMH